MRIPRLPAELFLVAVIVAVLGASAVGKFHVLQTTASVAKVHADLAWLRKGVFLYKCDQNIYPRMAWGADGIAHYTPNVDGQPQGDSYAPGGKPMVATLTRQMTTPIAYLARFDLRDPAYPSDSSLAPLYTYQAAWCHDVLRLVGGSTPGASVNPIAENRAQRRDFGEFFLLSLGPKGNPTLYWPAVPADNPPYDGYFTQYDPTNGVVSSGTIYLSEKNAEPVQRTY